LRQNLQWRRKIWTIFPTVAEHFMSISRTLRYKPRPPIAQQYVTILYNFTYPFSILHNSRFHLLQQGQISYFKPVTARIHTLCVWRLHSVWRQKSNTGIYYVGRCEL
jgi:hypothetical protein